MNFLKDIRGNLYFTDINPQDLTVKSEMEMVIIYTEGKSYKAEEGHIETTSGPIKDLRLMVNEDVLEVMISTIERWKKLLHQRQQLADKYITPILEEVAKSAKNTDSEVPPNQMGIPFSDQNQTT